MNHRGDPRVITRLLAKLEGGRTDRVRGTGIIEGTEFGVTQGTKPREVGRPLNMGERETVIPHPPRPPGANATLTPFGLSPRTHLNLWPPER